MGRGYYTLYRLWDQYKGMFKAIKNFTSCLLIKLVQAIHETLVFGHRSLVQNFPQRVDIDVYLKLVLKNTTPNKQLHAQSKK